MIRWPWVSRTLYDLVLSQNEKLWGQINSMVDREAFNVVFEEREYLREKVSDLMDHTKRIDRVEHGLSEEERKERADLGEMPVDMQKYFSGWPPAIRQHQINLAWAQRRAGRTWDDIWAEILTKRKERDDE